MRKTEIGLGIAAGAAGMVLGLLSVLGILPYAQEMMQNTEQLMVFGYLLIGVNALGIIGALMIARHHIFGSVLMAAVIVLILVFGFPWQAFPAVVYFMSVVMAVVPVKVSQ